MSSAPARDLMFSQSARRREPAAGFCFPRRALATTLLAIDARSEKGGCSLRRAGNAALQRTSESYPTYPRLVRIPAHAQGARRRIGAPPGNRERRSVYLRCLLTSFVISNIET